MLKLQPTCRPNLSTGLHSVCGNKPSTKPLNSTIIIQSSRPTLKFSVVWYITVFNPQNSGEVQWLIIKVIQLNKTSPRLIIITWAQFSRFRCKTCNLIHKKHNAIVPDMTSSHRECEHGKLLPIRSDVISAVFVESKQQKARKKVPQLNTLNKMAMLFSRNFTTCRCIIR